KSRKVLPELIDLEEFLGFHGITRLQLIDMGILIGTDFNKGIKGIGPKTSLKLIKKHGSLENLPVDIKAKLPDTIDQIRDLYLHPEVTDKYTVEQGELMEDALDDFLCGERNFSTKRVQTLINRMRTKAAQKSLKDYFGGML
ncbi:MAG: flap structure-specific endonuclease, partial [Candidatus Bathyarchaeota archaeon]|nr:flap structure-specific endonuclease [Candidatus Bathyarchaeota archaeon]